MKKRRSLPPSLPPLSFQALDEVRDVEDAIQDVLRDCDDNLERVRQTLHTGVAEKLNVLMGYYFSLPTPQIAWFARIIPRTVDSIIGMCSALVPGDQFRDELIRTAAHQLAQRLEADTIKNKAVTAAPPKPASSERTALRDSYLASFTGVKIKIIDICWAAGQHKREWKRWLKGELKDGGTADLAFHRLLTSGKRPKEFRRQLRTPGWE